MIYTVTFNPALDYVIAVDHFSLGRVNRTVREEIFCGGKGINVSGLLANLGVESTALGFVAGFTGKEIERKVKAFGISSDFIHVKNGMSRINVKLKSEEETEINGMGPDIRPEDVKALFEKLDRLGTGDVLVLSGSIPPAVGNDIYRRIMEPLKDRGVRIAVDAERDLLTEVLPLKPFLVKPNTHELGQILGKELKAEAEIIEGAMTLKDWGAANVLVSMAEKGAILVDENGDVHRQGACRGTVKNSVGAGDSMVAGFLAGYLSTGDYGYALRLGTASGAATAFSSGLGTGEQIMELLSQLTEKQKGSEEADHMGC